MEASYRSIAMSKQRKLRELLQEQQEPFLLNTNINGSTSPSFCCCHGNAASASSWKNPFKLRPLGFPTRRRHHLLPKFLLQGKKLLGRALFTCFAAAASLSSSEAESKLRQQHEEPRRRRRSAAERLQRLSPDSVLEIDSSYGVEELLEFNGGGSTAAVLAPEAKKKKAQGGGGLRRDLRRIGWEIEAQIFEDIEEETLLEMIELL